MSAEFAQTKAERWKAYSSRLEQAWPGCTKFITMSDDGRLSCTGWSDGEGFNGRSDVLDLSPLSGLSFSGLLLQNVPASDLRPLAGSRINVLSLMGSKVVDLSPLAESRIDSLMIDRTAIRDLSPLRASGVRNITARGTVLDPASLKGLDTLDGLDLASHPEPPWLHDLAPLAGLRLSRLGISGQAISDLSPISGMALTQLSIDATKVGDLRPLVRMPLTRLSMNGAPVRDLGPLAGMPIETLEMSGCPVTDLAPLGRLSRLDQLVLGNSAPRDLAVLVRALGAVPLKTLGLQVQADTDLAPLAKLSGLRCLMLGRPGPNDLRPLNDLRLHELVVPVPNDAQRPWLMTVDRHPTLKKIRIEGLTGLVSPTEAVQRLKQRN